MFRLGRITEAKIAHEYTEYLIKKETKNTETLENNIEGIVDSGGGFTGRKILSIVDEDEVYTPWIPEIPDNQNIVVENNNLAAKLYATIVGAGSFLSPFFSKLLETPAAPMIDRSEVAADSTIMVDDANDSGTWATIIGVGACTAAVGYYIYKKYSDCATSQLALGGEDISHMDTD